MKTKIEILDHELVPKHIILSEEEKQKTAEAYGIKKMNKFPTILESDPVIKDIGGKPGNLVKIIRKSNIVGEVGYYRLVVED